LAFSEATRRSRPSDLLITAQADLETRRPDDRRLRAKWRTRRLQDITTDDIARLHDRLGKGNGRYAANRTVALLRTMFNLARDWGYLNTANAAMRIKVRNALEKNG